jgi:predicted kinase
MATATKSPPAKARPATTGAIIDQLWAARENKRVLEAQAKEVGAKIEEIETTLMDRLGAEGLEKATGSKASVSISSSVNADVQDWDAFWGFIIKNKYTHLLQRRVSEPAYRELLEAGKKVVGVQPFTKKKLNLRTLA